MKNCFLPEISATSKQYGGHGIDSWSPGEGGGHVTQAVDNSDSLGLFNINLKTLHPSSSVHSLISISWCHFDPTRSRMAAEFSHSSAPPLVSSVPL